MRVTDLYKGGVSQLNSGSYNPKDDRIIHHMY
jgi:hypothetical protein